VKEREAKFVRRKILENGTEKIKSLVKKIKEERKYVIHVTGI
jgi:hypothetical protein